MEHQPPPVEPPPRDIEGIVDKIDATLGKLGLALQLEWDGKTIPKELRALRDDETADALRRTFQQTFLLTPHGRYTLAVMLIMLHWNDPEIVTDRERISRNFAAKLLELCGLSSTAERLSNWIGQEGPRVFQEEETERLARAQNRQRAEYERKHRPPPQWGGGMRGQPPNQGV